MASTFRLYGPEIGKSTAVVDADVTGVALDGSIELTPANGDPSFTLDPEKLREMAGENLAYDKDDIDTKAEVWGAIEDVEDHYEKASDDGTAFIDAAKTLFRGA